MNPKLSHKLPAAAARGCPAVAYEPEAYEFVQEALTYTVERLGRMPKNAEPGEDNHVNGHELLDGACAYATEQYGMLARLVLHLWGIDRTDDIGAIVFSLIDRKVFSRSARDREDDFKQVFDLDQRLAAAADFPSRDDEWGRR